jgi:hypothetical protein
MAFLVVLLQWDARKRQGYTTGAVCDYEPSSAVGT